MCITRFKRRNDMFLVFFCFGIGGDVCLPVCLRVRAHTRRHAMGQRIKYFVLTQFEHASQDDLWHVQHDVTRQAFLPGTNGMWHVLFLSRICLKAQLRGQWLFDYLTLPHPLSLLCPSHSDDRLSCRPLVVFKLLVFKTGCTFIKLHFWPSLSMKYGNHSQDFKMTCNRMKYIQCFFARLRAAPFWVVPCYMFGRIGLIRGWKNSST